jgi:hypothetical protein
MHLFPSVSIHHKNPLRYGNSSTFAIIASFEARSEAVESQVPPSIEDLVASGILRT